MKKLSQKQNSVLKILLQDAASEAGVRSSEVYAALRDRGEDVSLITVKRILSNLLDLGYIHSKGSGRSVSYTITTPGRVFSEIDAQEYCESEPDDRYGSKLFNFSLFSEFPHKIFTQNQHDRLESATVEYRDRTKDISGAIEKRELERLVIELAWKSSKIEGNTYTLLETEKLIKDHQEAKGRSREETQMILNHKDAFLYIRKHQDQYVSLSLRMVEDVHRLLVKDLGVEFGLRDRPVGITGCLYRPLDNTHQIRESLDRLLVALQKMEGPYAEALLCLLGISYLQPFEDGNKRTARLLANAILLAHDLAPLSYRGVDEKEYKEATLVFYELNSIQAWKDIFLEQYVFAAENYLVR